MLLSTILASAFPLFVGALSTRNESSSWPYAPFHTSGRYIKDARNETVTYAGVNWPGAADVMIPEGLQYQSISTIVSKIKSLGMNVIRLTYAIEMIDDIYESGDVSLADALVIALGTENGTAVLDEILTANPSFTPNTTRLEIFDAVAAECYNQQIYVHLDNHMSKGEWCCSHNDGNAWFGDVYFNVENWRRGLSYMAAHAKSWPAFTSFALRNELRFTNNDTAANATYDWPTWYANMVPAASAVHAANPDPLIFYSGLDYDTKLGPITSGSALDGNGTNFLISDYTYADKIVFELHNYDTSSTDTSCASLRNTLYNGGYNAMDTSTNTTAVNIAPVVLTEFGFNQNNATYTSPYATCIKKYVTDLAGGPGGWMQWVIAGSYYIRKGVQDQDEAWGLLNHDWSDWRSEASALNYTKGFVQETLG